MALPYYDDRMAELVAEQFNGADILLLGRATYQIFAGSWPQRGDEVPLATRINTMPKLVVSTTLRSAAWQNTTVIAGDIPEELAKIKEQPGGNITISGSPTLVRSLLRTVCWTSCNCWSTHWSGGTADAGSKTA